MKKISWSIAALADIERLSDFIRFDNQDTARRAVTAIGASLKILARTPGISRSVIIEGIAFFEKPIVFGSGVYVARYNVNVAEITILAFRNGHDERARHSLSPKERLT